ncbi:hypothetical protein ABIE52_000330 [Rhodococcus sp. OAS809]
MLLFAGKMSSTVPFEVFRDLCVLAQKTGYAVRNHLFDIFSLTTGNSTVENPQCHRLSTLSSSAVLPQSFDRIGGRKSGRFVATRDIRSWSFTSRSVQHMGE